MEKVFLGPDTSEEALPDEASRPHVHLERLEGDTLEGGGLER